MPRVYSPIEPGIDDPRQYPLKEFAMTTHERGVPITELPEVWGVSSSTVMAATAIDSNGATAAVAITAGSISLVDDAIQIDWYRGTTLMYSLVLGVLDAVRPDAVSVGDTMDDTNSQSFGETINGEHRGFRQGRTADNRMLIQQDENATVTLAANDEIRVSMNIYETGVLGNKFARTRTPQSSTIWIKTRDISQPTHIPSGTTYNGQIATLSPSVAVGGWVLLSAPDPSGSAPLWYARAEATYSHSTRTWSVGAFTVLTFPADRVESGLEITFSPDGSTRHVAPQLSTDKYVHFRLTPDGAWQQVSINPVRDQWRSISVETSWFPTVGNARRNLTLTEPIDLDEYSFVQISVRGSVINRATAYPYLFPTNRLQPSTATAMSWQNGISYVIVVNPDGSQYYQTDNFSFPAGRWNGFSLYPYRASGDNARILRGFRVFGPLDTAGSNGMIINISVH